MNMSDRKILSLLENTDLSEKKKGLKIAVASNSFSMLPNILKLASQKNLEISTDIRKALISLSKNCLHKRNKIGLQPFFISSAVTAINKYSPEYVNNLFLDLESQDDETIINSIVAIKYFAPEEKAREILNRLIKHTSNKVKATAVLHLGYTASKLNADIIGRYLKNSDNRIKSNAVEVIEQLNNKNLVPIISRLRKDNNNRVRANVLKAMFNLNKVDIKEDLKTMLVDDNELMRTSAVWVIGEIGSTDKTYFDMLRYVINDTSKLVKDNLIIVIKKNGNVPELEFLRVKLKDLLKGVLKTKIIKNSEISIEKIDRMEYLLFRLSGSVTFQTILSLKLRMEEIDNELSESIVVFDFGNVGYIDSSGVGLMVNFSKKCIKKTETYLFVIVHITSGNFFN